MLHLPANLTPLLRTSLFALLLLGALVRPMLNLLGDLHATEHAVTAAEHDHHHGDDERAPADPDHAKGLHVLFHQADTHAAASLWSELHWRAEPAPSRDGPTLDVVWRPSQQPSSPFRPPIA